MWNKSFLEARKIDVSRYVKKRDGIDYLPWAACKLLLHENGAEKVDFDAVPGDNGSVLLMSDQTFEDKNGVKNRCYEVMVKIRVDSEEWYIHYPVMNGNNPVKDNSMNQLRVSNAVRRAFVKGVAQHLGLGFDLWLDDDDIPETDDLSKHNIMKIRQRTEELITSKIKSGIPFTVLCDRLGKDEEEVRSMLGWYKILAKLEHDIWEIQR